MSCTCYNRIYVFICVLSLLRLEVLDSITPLVSSMPSGAFDLSTSSLVWLPENWGVTNKKKKKTFFSNEVSLGILTNFSVRLCVQQQVASTQQTPQHFLRSLSHDVVRGCCLFLFYFYFFFHCRFFVYILWFTFWCDWLCANICVSESICVSEDFSLPPLVCIILFRFVCFLKDTCLCSNTREKERDWIWVHGGGELNFWEKFKEGKPYSKYIVLKKILILF